MKAVNKVVLTVALALLAGPAVAFDEQHAGGTASTVRPAAGIVVDNSRPVEARQNGVQLEMRAPENTSGPKGTEVFIPGLGSLGVLPRMDFGLELLYGAAESPKASAQDETTIVGDDDLTIKGRIKHRF